MGACETMSPVLASDMEEGEVVTPAAAINGGWEQGSPLGGIRTEEVAPAHLDGTRTD